MSEEEAVNTTPEEAQPEPDENGAEMEAPSDPEEKNDEGAGAGGRGVLDDDGEGADSALAAKVESMEVADDGNGDSEGGGDDQKTPNVDLPPTATSLPVTDESRTTSLSKLRAYEAARRSAYKSKLASSSLYWRSFRELLHSSIEETERAEQIFKASAESNTAYAISLRAAHNDTLDEQGRPVVDPKKRKKLIEGREKRREKASAGPAGTLTAEESSDKGKKTAATSKLHVPDKSFDRQSSAKGDGILDALIESQGKLADRFSEYAKYVYDEAVPEIVEIRQALVMEVTLMEKLGDAIQEELDAAEQEVHDAWSEYLTLDCFVLIYLSPPVIYTNQGH
jgi:hypothetical protein